MNTKESPNVLMCYGCKFQNVEKNKCLKYKCCCFAALFYSDRCGVKTAGGRFKISVKVK